MARKRREEEPHKKVAFYMAAIVLLSLFLALPAYFEESKVVRITGQTVLPPPDKEVSVAMALGTIIVAMVVFLLVLEKNEAQIRSVRRKRK